MRVCVILPGYFSKPSILLIACLLSSCDDEMILTICACSAVPDSFPPHGLQPTKLLCPWDFRGKNIGLGCHFLLKGIFFTQGLKLHLLHQQVDSTTVPPEKPNDYLYKCLLKRHMSSLFYIHLNIYHQILYNLDSTDAVLCWPSGSM